MMAKSFGFVVICVQHSASGRGLESDTSQTSAFLPAAFAFIVLRDDAGDSDVVVNELRSAVATKIAKYAVPDEILVSGASAVGATVLLVLSLLF